MPRVKPETIEKLNAFFDTLPKEQLSKCSLCRETLTHICKTAEVETGAGTATTTRVLSEKINDSAAPGDRVSGENLRRRVRYQEEDIRTNCPDKTETQGSDKREGAGRKPRSLPQEFKVAFGAMETAIINAKKTGWKSISKKTASSRVEMLANLVNY